MATMFPCPNCGGQLRFSPEDQKLKCKSCGSLTDIDSYAPDDKIGMDTITTNVYECPSCGGEIQLIDNDGMEFCPYCGNQATMQEKFSTEGAPKYILPFQLNKAKARDKYRSLTGHLHFTPEGLEDKDNIEKLVGMYVPYYLYDYSIDDEIEYKGTTTHSTSDYYITDYANVDVTVKVDSLKVPFDASQTLDDSIAAKLEPFPMDEVRSFHPGYLAGFFVENSTVDKDVYKSDSLDKAVDYLCGEVAKGSHGYHPEPSTKYEIETKLTNDLKYDDAQGAYMPMYFMTTKYNDRVAYTIINGANGVSYIDMPIDKKKMYAFGGKVSAGIFVVLLLASFILNFSFNVKSLCSFGALVSSIIALVGAILAECTYSSDQHLNDKGYFQNTESVKANKIKKPKKTSSSLTSAMLTGVITIIAIAIFAVSMEYTGKLLGILPYIFYPASVVMIIMALVKVKKGEKKVMLLGILAWAFSIVVRLINLPNDIFYYAALMVAFVVIIVSINAIVNEYNRFATHPAPQFLKKGGRLENARD
ncbi:zinc ribbon domain-containing protein [Pseudobutyrivibrio xylanivorans]|uniref:Replication restart DNA helicase PriA n=1 Tax=Pseudobutyrivibrio xylanivorans DSM 14809 TaxID=1123012 RepID=A0A1M6L4C6_PSEXY|nr:zinc ribbon domain-containing protein [Pseudobutyrivibrio xylanivorans]SHJ66081.1 hypothetical protein SAMN02745725_03018 [Pseudobutyrivibrio xylanivorans DSM 14809]